MTGATRRRRWNWKKVVSYVVLVYLVIWASHSTVQFVRLRQDEAAVTSKIALARARNRALARQLSDLHNPAYVKEMLLGKVVTPRPDLNGISSDQRPS